MGNYLCRYRPESHEEVDQIYITPAGAQNPAPNPAPCKGRTFGRSSHVYYNNACTKQPIYENAGVMDPRFSTERLHSTLNNTQANNWTDEQSLETDPYISLNEVREQDLTNDEDSTRVKSPAGRLDEDSLTEHSLDATHLKQPASHRSSKRSSSTYDSGRGSGSKKRSIKRWLEATPRQHIEHMVNTYRPHITQTISVKEMLVHVETAMSKHGYSTLEALLDKKPETELAEMLLESIEVSNEPGKWQTFINALEKLEYGPLLKLLRCEWEDDQTDRRELLKILSPGLLNNIHLSECIDQLYSRGIINEEDKQQIECMEKMHGTIAGTRKMFQLFPRRSVNWTTELAHILKAHGLGDYASFFIEENDDLESESHSTSASPRVPARIRQLTPAAHPDVDPHLHRGGHGRIIARIETLLREFEYDNKRQRLEFKTMLEECNSKVDQLKDVVCRQSAKLEDLNGNEERKYQIIETMSEKVEHLSSLIQTMHSYTGLPPTRCGPAPIDSGLGSENEVTDCDCDDSLLSTHF
ncbi:uncharacterized protein LOC127853321 [Dreissena polymorpha]|uniref:Caspase recruitment domain-containing protein n=1 Tax=Dreissena polymorpha TaxID=45954 RepID=A0A9D4NCP3_DREPO|nr:uncharacterized protein LOC127853321 [Dreissena polymorpha]KAH3890847.1 hypothetical protein DPMN_014936 [Dreissena polymorpha]